MSASESYDVFLAGPLFMDIVFSGMPHAPVLGTETWADSMGCCPGGIANMAVALSRLGRTTSLATSFGDDAYGDFCRESLELSEGIDISSSVRTTGSHTPVTISLAYEGDRTMVSHGHISQGPDATAVPEAKFVFATVESGRSIPWLEQAHRAGARVFVNSGWDRTGQWDLAGLSDLQHADVFIANETEAMAWTKTDSPAAAAHRLARQVPLAVVTRGSHGVIAVDSALGELVEVPAMTNVDAVDTTGAGDILIAGMMAGLGLDCSLRDSLALGCVAAGLSVQWIGGSFSAPTWDEIRTWYRTHPSRGLAGFEKDYGFIDRLFPEGERPRRPRRAIPTMGFRP
ncbi:MAG: carbohydrate kinase family protein [Microbacteriaceae bacterium]